MNKITLGKTNLVIEKNGFGCLPIQRISEQDAVDLLHKAYDGGINFFDTANSYSAGTSEEYLGKALKKNVSRDKVVIASKVYFNPGRLSRKAIHREIDGSLKRLGTDYLDLYIIHRFDYETPIAETMAYPNRTVSGVEPLDFFKIKELTFIEPDFNRYPNLKLAIDAFAEGQYATTAMNAANEIAVQAFLDGYIKFTDIAKINQVSVEQMPSSIISSIDDVLAVDKQARELAASLIKKLM